MRLTPGLAHQKNVVLRLEAVKELDAEWRPVESHRVPFGDGLRHHILVHLRSPL
jgi:hypothetical protein